MVERDRSKARAHELAHRVPDSLHHAAHQAVTTLMHDDFNGRDVAVGIDDAEGINLDRAVLQLDSVHERALHARLDLAVQTRHVGLANLVRRVGQTVRELAVVRQQQQAGRVNVQTPHVVQALRIVGDEVSDRGAPLRVAHRGHGTNRLVDGQDDVLGLVEDQALSIHVNDLLRGVNADALAAHDGAVNTHPAVGDHLFGRTPGCDAGLGEHLLQAHSTLGVGVSPHSSSSNSSSASASGR